VPVPWTVSPLVQVLAGAVVVVVVVTVVVSDVEVLVVVVVVVVGSMTTDVACIEVRVKAVAGGG
jgi:hypothetical protein